MHALATSGGDAERELSSGGWCWKGERCLQSVRFWFPRTRSDAGLKLFDNGFRGEFGDQLAKAIANFFDRGRQNGSKWCHSTWLRAFVIEVGIRTRSIRIFVSDTRGIQTPLPCAGTRPMTCLQTGDRARTWCIADVVLIGASGTLAFLLGCYELFDPDIWWHLRSGQWILEHGRVPRLDIFSFASADRVWVDLHWGFQVLLAIAYSVGGRCRDDSAGIHRGLRGLLDRNDGPRPRMAALAGRPVLAPRTCPHGHATRSPAGGFLARLSRLLPRRTGTSGTTSEIGLAPAACPALLGQYSRSFRARTHRALLLHVRMRRAFMGRLTNGR